MCYSAQIWADYRKYERFYGATLTIKEFAEMFWERQGAAWAKAIPKGLRDSLHDPRDDDEATVKARFDAIRQELADKDQAEIDEQSARLELNRAKLAAKPGLKGAANEVRVASNKIAAARRRLEDVMRETPKPADDRIWPGWYAPVMIWENGRRVVKPMRFRCRPARASADYDEKYPGTFNARLDNLESFWRGEFGHTHAVVIASRFYESVDYDRYKHEAQPPGARDRSIELVFTPDTGQDMVIACLYSHWVNPDPDGDDLWSFAFITTDPPPEVAAAGHDRCIMPIKPENIDRWLQPAPNDLAGFYEILEDRELPYYNHAVVKGLDSE